MKIRKVDSTGDVVFGQPNDYYINTLQGMALLIKDRLNLWTGEWFQNTSDGVPYLTDMIQNNSLPLLEATIKKRILSTPNVTSIKSFQTNYNKNTRELILSITIITQFGDVTIEQGVT